MTKNYITLTLATTPAQLGEATQADLECYNHLLESRNLVGREVGEEFFLALLTEAGREAAGEDEGDFSVWTVDPGPATEAALGRPLVICRTLAEAQAAAEACAMDYSYGVAVLDENAGHIHWGGEITDREGNAVG